MNIKVKDRVIVITGRDKGKQGIVKKVYKESSKLLVENVNFVKKHVNGKIDGDEKGFKMIESPIHLSNVMLICEKCNMATRIKVDRLTDGKKIRICKKCGESII